LHGRAREALDRSAECIQLASGLRHQRHRESRREHADTPAVRAGQPQIRAMGGPAAPRSYAEYKPRTETLRRARLYGCSTRDPLLRKIRRKKPAPPPIPEQKPAPEPVITDLHERLFAYHHPRQEPRPIVGREGHFYAGNAVVPPGSMRGAAYRYGGRGASILVRRSADRTNKGVPSVTSFEAASVSLLADEWAPPLRNETLGYVAGPSTTFSCRCWPDEARFPGAGAFAKNVLKETFRGSEFYSSQTTATLAEVGRRKKERLRRSRARPKSASIRRDTYGHLVDGREPVPRGPQHVDPRARRQHRQTKATFNFHSARPLKRQPVLNTRRPKSAPSKRPSTNTNDDTHVYHQSGKNLILERNETREEVIRRVQLERFRKDDRKAQLKWQSLKAFLRACELHFLLDRTVIDAEAPLLVKVADLFDAKKTVSRSTFRASMASLNITKDLSGALGEHFSDENGFNALGLLLALRLLADTYPGTSRREPLEAKLPGLLELFERSEGGVDDLSQLFCVASKSDDERHSIKTLLELRLRPLVHELLGEDVVLTAQIINSALSRCPELFHALKEQASHACIAKNVVKTDLGRARDAVASQSPVVFSDDEDEYEEDAIADDEYVDVDGVVRPKGLGVHNSLINWTNKAVPLGQRV
jgi:hypothetical protein